jgi:hypothetical protein
MKQLFSCIDCFLPAPQPEQHNLIRAYAKSIGGEIVFYGAEEHCVGEYQGFIIPKLRRTPNLDGVVFFTFDQFCYGRALNYKILNKILTLKLSVHFAREAISVDDIEQLGDMFLVFSAYFHSFSRQRSLRSEAVLELINYDSLAQSDVNN